MPWAQSLAYLLEATGAVALEQCGAILDSQVSDEEGSQIVLGGFGNAAGE